MNRNFGIPTPATEQLDVYARLDRSPRVYWPLWRTFAVAGLLWAAFIVAFGLLVRWL